MSLSQEDFRKLLSTPRAPVPATPSSKAAKFAKPAPVQRNKQPSEFARPIPAKFRKKPEDEEDAGPSFRDRAKERRQGVNPDYKDSEEIIARLAAAEEKELADNADIKSAIYQQSKYLGGDEKHTHLVKGLDFALLKKVRTEMQKSDVKASEEQEAEEFLERVANESVIPASTDSISFTTSIGERIHAAAMESNEKALPQTNELFKAGRMAFCWDIRSDDIPTTVIRSKGDLKDELKSSTADSEVVIGKIIEILASVRFGTRSKEGLTVGEKKALKKKEREDKLKAELDEAHIAPMENLDAMDEDGEDIFADVGRDYSLEVVDKSTGERVKAPLALPSTTGPKSYFAKPILDSDDEQDDDEAAAAGKSTADILKMLVPAAPSTGPSATDADNDDMFADLDDTKPKSKPAAPITSLSSTKQSTEASVDSILKSSAAMLNELQGAGTAELLISENSAKPKKAGLSLTRLANNYGEEDPEFDQYYDSDDGDEEEEAAADANQMDQGIKARKRTQMRRFDFDTEEEFQAYKDSQVVMPKTAYQFGVKSSDGRKNRKEMSGGGGSGKGPKDEERKLEKEMKQLDKMMGQKYGISITDNGSNKKRGGNDGGQSSKKKRI
ncbi:RED-like protein N-terminal region-domain-containing protein [Chytriomyces cf. hyalinus JEL632]|nr:RED-like protein N-terminal region-domain-containing protein [Chytriomyces cf. hyalinus JEL632]